ncbi:MAG TPA: transposase family protein [Ktedonobacteraceae bacterium]|nr:transposase family protein [Ktedonobacteraceae bacterium]
MNYTLMGEVLESLDLPSSLEARSAYQALQQLQDGRARRGVRYSVVLVLTLIILGKLVGMTTPEAMSEWVQLRADWLRQMVPNPRRRFPCTSTYRNILLGVDAEHVRAVLSQVLIRAAAQKRCEDEPSPPGRPASSPETCAHGPGWQNGTGNLAPSGG